MPHRDAAPDGAPCWIDLMTSDVDASRAFYGGLFGWTAEDAGEEYGGYVTFSLDGRPVAGCMRNDGQSGHPDVWSTYLATPDARATTAKAEANGGKVVMPAMEVMDLGVMGFVVDAGGAAIGLWQPGLHKGFGVWAEPNTATWFELLTREYDTAVAFYRTVFGWDTEVTGDTPEFRYTTLGHGEDRLAGVMDAGGFLPEGVPSHWSVYFRVDDTDAAIATAERLGAKVLRPAEDTPYGRLAQLADPTGVSFKLVDRA